MTDSTPPARAVNYGWQFKGWGAFFDQWVVVDRVRRAMRADFFDRLSSFSRTVGNLSERLLRKPPEPIRPAEFPEIRRTLGQLGETVDVYALSAAAVDAAARAGRRAYGLLAPDDDGPTYPPFEHMHFYVAAECRELRLPEDLVLRAVKNTEVHYCSAKLGQLADAWRRAAKDADGRPVVSTAELARVEAEFNLMTFEGLKLHVAVGMCRAMLDEARAAYGLDGGAA